MNSAPNPDIFYRDWWEYDPCTGTWTRKADFPGTARDLPFRFVINDTIYVGGGRNLSTVFSDVYAYDPQNDTWFQVANLPLPLQGVAGTSDSSHGYIFGGLDAGNNTRAEVYRYDPQTNTWVQIGSFPAGGRFIPFLVHYNGKLYMGTGMNSANIRTSDFYSLDLATLNWQQLPNYPQQIYDSWGTLLPGGKILVSGGHRQQNPQYTAQFYYFDVNQNQWVPIAIFPPGPRNNSGCEWTDYGVFCGFGQYPDGIHHRDWWLYCPR